MRVIKGLRWFFTSQDAAAINQRRIAKLAFVAALLAALFWIIPVKKIVQALLATNPWLFLLAIVITLFADLLTASQMKILLGYQHIRRSLLYVWHTNLAVKFYLQFTPSTLIASGIRWYRFSQPEGQVTEALVGLVFYRVFEIFLTIAIGTGYLLISAQKGMQVSYAALVGLLVVIMAAWVVATRYSLPIYNWLKAHSGSLSEHRYIAPLLRRLEKLLEAASAYARMPMAVLLGTVALGIITAQFRVLANLVNARAVGIDLGFLQIGWITMAVSIITQMPFTVAGGLGVREVTLVAALSLFGVSSEQALAFSFLIFIRNATVGLIGGLWELSDSIRSKKAARLAAAQDRTEGG